MLDPLAVAVSALPLLFVASGGYAQAPASDPKPAYNKYGSPLDTLMSTRLWTDVPPAQGFVRETHPNTKDLDYTPLTGTDPERPKPRDAANVKALQAELERDGAQNEKKGRALRGPAKAARTKRLPAAE